MGVEVHSLHIVSTDIARGGDTSQCGRDKSTSPFSHTILVQGRVPHISPWSMKGRLFTWPLLVGLESKIKFYSLVFDWTIYQLLSKSFLSCLAALFLVFLLEKVGISWIFFFFLVYTYLPSRLQVLHHPAQDIWVKNENPGNSPFLFSRSLKSLVSLPCSLHIRDSYVCFWYSD